MTPDDRDRIIIDRFVSWTQQLRALDATPFLVIGVGHADHRLHVFVPHRDAPETALMVQALRRAADDLETLGPEETR